MFSVDCVLLQRCLAPILTTYRQQGSFLRSQQGGCPCQLSLGLGGGGGQSQYHLPSGVASVQLCSPGCRFRRPRIAGLRRRALIATTPWSITALVLAKDASPHLRTSRLVTTVIPKERIECTKFSQESDDHGLCTHQDCMFSYQPRRQLQPHLL